MKGKCVSVQAMKECSGRKGLVTLILTSALMEFWPTSASVRFTFGKERQYRFNERVGGPHSPSGRFGEEKNSLP